MHRSLNRRVLGVDGAQFERLLHLVLNLDERVRHADTKSISLQLVIKYPLWLHQLSQVLVYGWHLADLLRIVLQDVTKVVLIALWQHLRLKTLALLLRGHVYRSDPICKLVPSWHERIDRTTFLGAKGGWLLLGAASD